MKNIHLIPTENYSPLVHSTNKYGGLFRSVHYFPMREMGDSYQHIYITSDEEIKEGDWVITYNGLLAKVITEFEWHFKNSKKIILTTDQDLIKDGVQPINDEFLDWFVKNPSCEFVNIEKYHGINTSIAEVNYISGDGSLSWQGRSDLRDYKIIIPQEEPKQIKCYCGHTITCDCEPLQETLEEAACKALGYDYNDWVSLFSKDKSTVIYSEVTNWCKGAKWQAERSYSEEDIKEAFFSGCQSERQIKPRIKCWEQWIEQFKKK
jgi:hypothetical protein